MLDNLNNSISENGRVDLEHFINLTNKTYEAINYTHSCEIDSEQLMQSCSVCGMHKHPVAGSQCKSINCLYEQVIVANVKI